MKHPSVLFLLLVGAILAVHLASSVPNQQHPSNRLKTHKPERLHHSKTSASDRQHHDAIDHQLRGKKPGKTGRQHHVPASPHHESAKQHHESSKQHHVPSKQHHLAAKQHHVADKQHHAAVKQHHEGPRAHAPKPRVHTSPVAHHAPSKHNAEGGKRHLEIQKPPKPFLQPPLLPKHDGPAKHHGKQERNNKHR